MKDKKKNTPPGALQDEQQEIRDRMDRIKHKIIVLSGKGGVGKSTVAVNLAFALSNEGFRVGILDIDIHGPSIPKLLGLEGQHPGYQDEKLFPVEMTGNLRVMSIGFLLQGSDDAVIWRGPLKMKMIQQFLKDVEWGKLDFLVVDSPPGTGDEPLSVIQLIENADGAIIVTTPQELSIIDVKRSISFCRKLGLPVIGVIENMSGFICPHCGKSTDIFKSGGGERMAKEVDVPFLGYIPLEPAITQSGDEGKPYLMAYENSDTARAFAEAIKPIAALETKTSKHEENKTPEVTVIQKTKGGKNMRIALPLAEGQVCMHFGHCEEFALVDVDPEAKKVIKIEKLTPPRHEPGVLPAWLAEQGAGVVVTGGMGQRAIALFQQNNIIVVTGSPTGDPEKIALDYLNGALAAGENICDH